MSEFKAQKSATYFLDEFAALVEFKKPVAVAPVEDEGVTLGIRGYCDGFPQVLARREFQEVRHGSKRNFADILNGRLALRKRWRERRHGESDRQDNNLFHGNLLNFEPNFRMTLYAKRSPN
jgi:hypothetical protein